MTSEVARRFGTGRGLVRLLLSYPEVALGQAAIAKPDPLSIRRLVFVCHGNICRSAFADVLARNLGLNAASFGLSTRSGLAVHPPAQSLALSLGVDLSPHRTTRVEDYAPHAGDLLLAMETRQLRRIGARAELAALPRTLLGLYARPVVPHLHDPFELDDAYMAVCLQRIKTAVVTLAAAFPGARSGG